MSKKVLIVGANGVVGFAAMKHFTSLKDCEVITISRKKPLKTFNSEFFSVDLLDKEQCLNVISKFSGITHIIYCAVYEKRNLLDGWVDEDQITKNDNMLRNLMESIDYIKNPVKHITLLQGTKAYGTHVGAFKIPAREGRSERRDIPNFYWKQENYIKEKQQKSNWHFTILRPRIIFGEAIGSSMNIIPAIGVYAALLKERGEPLHYPGKEGSVIMQAVDADLLAKGIEWAGESDNAQNETFNITNGDIFVWNNIWPAIAEALEMKLGENKPLLLNEVMPSYAEEWDNIREKYNLDAPDIESFVSSSFEYADNYLNADKNRTPSIVSTIKIQQAGFYECLDTEQMFIKWFDVLRDRNLLPK